MRQEFFLVCLEEIRWLLWVIACDIMERRGADIVGLALSNQRVIFEEILKLGFIALGLGVKNLFRFGSEEEVMMVSTG